MDIKKRAFLKGGALLGAGLAAVGLGNKAQAQYPAGVPRATGRSMLDSPNYAGSASKGYGFRANWARTLPQPSTVDPAYKPRRINKAIELWEGGHTVSYAEFGASGAPDTYEEGKRMAKTFHDSITYEMENGCFDFSGLRNFMQGLVDGGPTPSGHRTPMVFPSIPAWGFDGASMRANAWQISQCLAAGAHGVLICEMESPEAAEVAIAAARYKWTWPGLAQLPIEGMRGAGSQNFAAHIWGISEEEYWRVADVWPYNPRGEISIGVKLENRRAVASCEQILAVKGIAFCEAGPSDNGLSHLGWDAVRPDITPAQRAALPATKRLQEGMERVRLACKKNGVMWQGGGPPGASRTQQIDEGRRMGGGTEETLKADREYTKRTMPV